MSKAIFFNIPASGHVYPSLAMTAELVRRGEQVLYFATKRHRRVIEATGAAFRPYTMIDDHFIDQPGLDGTNLEQGAEAMLKASQAMLPELLEIVRTERPDYILHDSMCAWGTLAARILGIPTAVSLALWTFTPALIADPRRFPNLLQSPGRGLSHVIGFHKLSRSLAAQYGIQPLTLPECFNATGNLTISYSSAMLQPDSHLLGDRVEYVGCSITARGDEPDFPLERLEGKQVVYISLGTVLNKNPEFFRNCLAAFEDSPCTVVMSIGNRLEIEELGQIPGHFIVRREVPPIEILKRSGLFISHSGMNSVHEALCLDVPLLLAPQQAEQAITADRIVELGAGLLLEDQAPGSLRRSAEMLLNDPGYRHRASLLGASLRAAGGPRRAADLVLSRVAAVAGSR